MRLARLCGTGWAGRRVAFALRAIGIRALAGRPLDVDSLGARMRLYPANNVAEKNLLFTPQYFDPQERRFLTERLAPLAREHSPFADGRAPRAARFVEPRLVARVEFSEWTHARTLRQPSYKGLREDVDPADVVIDPRAPPTDGDAG